MNELVVITPEPTQEYVSLVSHIANLWEDARNNAITAVNESLLMASWKTGQYIVEFEQEGNAKAQYGERLLVNLSKDLTRLRGRGFSRSNLTYMRKFYLAFPKCETISHKLTWSHYFELLKCDDSLEMQFYMVQAINEGWKVKELKRQINSSLFQRLALSTDKEGVLAMSKQGQQYALLTDIITREWSGMTTRQYKQYKGLKKENLRDNMTNVELALNMLAEASTTEISKQKNPKGYTQSAKIAKEGGSVAKAARKQLESKTGKSAISSAKASDYLLPPTEDNED